MNVPVLLTIDPRGIATVMLNRPDKHNAFDGQTIGALHEVLEQLEDDHRVRVVVLTGAGKSFCAGADLKHMQTMAASSEAENFSDAMAFARCLRKLDELNKPVIARVNGNAFAGGVGLIACADIAITSSQAMFCLTEVRLGLATAVISPYLIEAIGSRQAQRLALTAASITAEQAQQLGLIHQHVDAQQLDQAIEQEIELLLLGAPLAQQATKRLFRETVGMTSEQRDMINARNAKLLAELRLSPEGQEGLQAFMEKRAPDWSH